MDSIVSAVREYAIQRPDKVAVISDGEKITYANLWKEVQGFAAYLNTLGLGRQSRIVMRGGSSIWFAVAAFGIHLAGHTMVPLEKTIGPEGLSKVAGELSAALAVTNEAPGSGLPWVDQAQVRRLALEHYRDGLELPLPTPDMVSEIMFTTGTTGKSKGVVLSHRAMFAATQNQQYGSHITEDCVYLIPAPINHVFALRKLYVSMIAGATAVLVDGYSNIKRLYACIDEYNVTSIALPPSAVRMLLVLTEKELARRDGQIRHVQTGGAVFPQADKDWLCRVLPHAALFDGYGSSEAGSACMLDYNKYKGKSGCVGKPNVNAKVLIVDDHRNPIESSKDNMGLVAITGPIVMNGYYNEPELTASVLQDGILYTNDIGYVDEEGFVYVLGRRDDVISVGGLKIAPTEVENVVLQFPGIAECVCYGVEDRMGGKSLRLNVVMNEGATLDQTALREHMSRHLEAFKLPKQIAIVDEIPKTPNGKINRKVLK